MGSNVFEQLNQTYPVMPVASSVWTWVAGILAVGAFILAFWLVEKSDKRPGKDVGSDVAEYFCMLGSALLVVAILDLPPDLIGYVQHREEHFTAVERWEEKQADLIAQQTPERLKVLDKQWVDDKIRVLADTGDRDATFLFKEQAKNFVYDPASEETYITAVWVEEPAGGYNKSRWERAILHYGSKGSPGR